MLSTYNGEKYLREQLDSIIANSTENIEITMMIRDDGSSDSTVEIIQKHRESLNICFCEGGNIGPAQSYRQLIEMCPLGFDAYAYADQDDIWSKDKIQSSLRDLNPYKDEIALWYSGIALFQNGEITQSHVCSQQRAEDFDAVMCTCSSMNGCVMVFNENLLRALKSCAPGAVDMHDSWTNLICLATGGHVICNSSAFVKYRIHGDQVLGLGDKSLGKTLKRMMNPSRLRSETAKTILTSSLILPKIRRKLERYADYRKLRNKAYLLFAPRSKQLTMKEYIKFKLQLVLNAF